MPEPTPRQKTPEEILRETVNNAAISLVGQGFDLIDRAAELGKAELKKAIIRGISGPRKKQP